jgi:hypothetical protein
MSRPQGMRVFRRANQWARSECQMESESDELYQKTAQWDEWETHTLAPNDAFNSFYCVNLRIVQLWFATTVNYLDDTSKTNNFDYPVFVLLCIDPENRSQMVAFGILSSRSTSAITDFLLYVYNMAGKHPETMVVDRNAAQIESIHSISNDINIVFCRYHLGKNIETKLVDRIIIDTYWDMMHSKTDEDEFLILLTEKEESPKTTEKQRRFIEKLKIDLHHWLPSITSPLIGDATTSCVEGVFGRLKDNLSHRLSSLFQVAQSLKSLSEL